MGDKSKLDRTDTFVPYDDHTSQTKLLNALGESLGQEGSTSAIQVREATAMLEEIIEGESPTVRHHYQPKAARVSWARRLPNWFMSRFWQSDLR